MSQNTPHKDIEELNKKYGLTEIYQHDFDNKTGKCKKCNIPARQLTGMLKLCAVIGEEEVSRFSNYDER